MKVGDKHSKGTFVESNEIDIKEIPTNSKLLLDMIEETSDWTTKSSDQNSPRNAYGYESDSNDVVISKGKEEIEISEKKIEEEKKLKPSGISIVELNKNKKNESKYFSKLVSIDKDAFGDLDGQVFILKQFWKSKTNKIIVAQKNNSTSISGYACFIPQSDGSCYLMRIAVRNASQRKGIGRQLMNYMFKEYMNKMELEVSADNLKGVKFYQKYFGVTKSSEYITNDGVKFYKYKSY